MRLLPGSSKLALSILGLLLMGTVAPLSANELGGSGAARGLVVHGADEVLRDFCAWDSSRRLWLTLPGGARYELVTSIDDPAISNHGDGAFHPFEVAEVRAALEAIRYPLAGLRADVFLLPYPRRGGLESAAGRELILLSPGVRPISASQQHAEVVHELGHVVQYARMPDSNDQQWDAYRRLRGIEDLATYSSASIHRDRPHEIFAEDFRALFGGPLAVSSGSIENPALAPPHQVPGLDRFLLSLTGALAVERVSVQPNPARGALRFSRPGAGSAALDLYDASGRHVVALASLADGEWMWDGLDAAGRRVAPGMLFARVRGQSGAPARVTLLP